MSQRWLTVGHHDPLFVGLDGAACRSTLDAPHVSSTQLRVRWLREPWLFEVEPVTADTTEPTNRGSGTVPLGSGLSRLL